MSDKPRNAGKDWTTNEEAYLANLFEAGYRCSSITDILQRSEGAIVSRLEKLGLVVTVGMKVYKNVPWLKREVR